jgi:hypothetical protein
MMFQAGMPVSIAVMAIGCVIHYFNEEYPERVSLSASVWPSRCSVSGCCSGP